MNSEMLLNRLLDFAKKCRGLTTRLPKNNYNMEYASQLIRASSSPGSNYIEAIEALSFKDFIHRLKICRKESKESTYWLNLIQSANQDIKVSQAEIEDLTKEAQEFIKIFTSSILTCEKNKGIRK